MNSDWISDRPIVESILARQPDKKYPHFFWSSEFFSSNLAGSQTKNTHIFFGRLNFLKVKMFDITFPQAS